MSASKNLNHLYLYAFTDKVLEFLESRNSFYFLKEEIRFRRTVRLGIFYPLSQKYYYYYSSNIIWLKHKQRYNFRANNHFFYWGERVYTLLLLTNFAFIERKILFSFITLYYFIILCSTQFPFIFYPHTRVESFMALLQRHHWNHHKNNILLRAIGEHLRQLCVHAIEHRFFAQFQTTIFFNKCRRRHQCRFHIVFIVIIFRLIYYTIRLCI